ncbi:hypothetical protein Tco_0308643 [Tanacetum coccineum]
MENKGKQVDAIYVSDDDFKDDAFFVSDYEDIAFSVSDYEDDSSSVSDYEDDASSVSDYKDDAFFVTDSEDDESEVDDDTYVMWMLPNVHASTSNVSKFKGKKYERKKNRSVVKKPNIDFKRPWGSGSIILPLSCLIPTEPPPIKDAATPRPTTPSPLPTIVVFLLQICKPTT